MLSSILEKNKMDWFSSELPVEKLINAITKSYIFLIYSFVGFVRYLFINAWITEVLQILEINVYFL